jgi:hypothetical protein
MKFKKYRNLDGPGAGTGGVVEAAPAAGIVTPSAEPTITPAVITPTAVTPLQPLDLDVVKTLKDFGDEAPVSKIAAEAKPTGAPKIENSNDEFMLSLEAIPDAVKRVEPDAESTWLDVAKAVDLGDIKEPTFEAFKESYTSKLQQEREAGKNEGKNLTLETWTDKQKALFEHLSIEGNTEESFYAPLSIYDKYLSMDDKSLLIEDYKLKNYEQDRIDSLIEELEVDNKLGNRAYELRKALETGRSAKEQQIIIDAREKVETRNTQIRERELSEFNSFKEKLHATKDFMGIPIAENAHAIIENKFKDGYYRTRLAEDPKLAADVALYIEFGNKARTLLGNDLKNEGRMQILEKIHNVGLPGSNAGRVEIGSTQLQGFDAWEAKMKEESSK